MASSSNGRTLKKADPSTIHNKFMVGYQGWFTCPGDGTPLDPHHHGWLHWFNYPIPDGGRPNTDLWPDVSEYSPSELFPAPGLKYANGDQAFLFSSRNPRTVERHFHWMALHGVDGAFLQRFLGQCDIEQGNQPIRDQRDEVGDNVRNAAEKEGRTYAIMYDVSGVAPDRIERVLQQDWIHLVRTKGILDSPNYLREKGKAVVTLWGFGMNDNGHDPNMVRSVTKFIRENTPGGAYIVGGSPAYWRTSESDADRNPEWVNVWLEEFDAISPWTIGRYHDLEGVDRFAEWNVKKDLELINKRNEEAAQGVPGRRKIDYIPVAFPGGSGFNLSEGKWSWNDAPRRGGRFLWREIWNLRRLGVRTIYGAMWDEYDEGTAFMPVVAKKAQLPVHDKFNFMALDEDGYDLHPDWYMRIAGFAAESLRGERFVQETFPSKELEDYWSTRPRYEEKSEKSEASGSGSGQSWEEWQKLEKEKEDMPPPPPYTLEADETSEGPSAPPENVLNAPPEITPVVAPLETRPVTAPLEQTPVVAPAEVGPVPVPLETRPVVASSGPAPIRMNTRPTSPTSSLGALNADPGRPPSGPSIPLSSRPSLSHHSPSSSLSVPGSSSPPPPLPLRSRPQPPDHQRQDSASVGALTEDLRRQNLSSTSSTTSSSSYYDGPLVQPPQGPQSTRPISPSRRPGTTSSSAYYDGPQVQPPQGPQSTRPLSPSRRPGTTSSSSYYDAPQVQPPQGPHRPVSPLSRPGTTASSSSSYYDGPLVQPPQGPQSSIRPVSPLSRPGTTPNDSGSSYQPSKSPLPGGDHSRPYPTPQGPPPPVHSSYPQGPSYPAPNGPPSPSPSAPWSHSAWPPPEWGVKPPSPEYSKPSFPGGPDYGGGGSSSSTYRPSYVSSSSSYGPPSPPSASTYGAPGGFHFPTADTYPYSAPQPQQQSYGPGGSSSTSGAYPPAPGFPGASGGYNVPYAVYQGHGASSTPPPPQGAGQQGYAAPYGPPPNWPGSASTTSSPPPHPPRPGQTPGPGPNNYNYSGNSYNSNIPPRPPQRPPSAYNRPPGSAYGPGGSSSSSGGNGVLGSLGGIAQTGLQTGEKLLNKFTGRR
ncbi:hypothetical protein BDW22DRAFT_1355324 [Trametopsis cervina]|nr:hypothetical protein BDW22DRAFT_1355324 [Trametopsis cervina]